MGEYVSTQTLVPLWKSDCLGCAVLFCLVCLTLLASVKLGLAGTIGLNETVLCIS